MVDLAAYKRMAYDRKSDVIDTVIFHHTGGLSDCRAWQVSTQSGSYHYLIDRWGRLLEGVDDERCSWGAKNDAGKRADWSAINVACIGDVTKHPSGYHQIRTAAALLAFLRLRYPIAVVTSHKALSPRNKPADDPDVAAIVELAPNVEPLRR